MGVIDTSYKPFDPLNICSICGTLERKSQLRRLPGGLFGCSRPSCINERTAVELDRANARQRPFRIRPVKDARPQTWNLPDSYEGDEGELLNFCARAVANSTRFENVTSGDRAPLSGQMLPMLGWVGRYLYGLISENKRPRAMLINALGLFVTIVTLLRLRQVGFGISSGFTRATNAAYGAFLESGASEYVTQDTASCGLVMLYGYRLLGTIRPRNVLGYRDQARAAASYLRNVQAIGSHGTNFTSNDSAGISRLYTGAVASSVSTASGFYSNHLFYPSDLLTLEFWNELKKTDGDQSVGATAVVTGFATTPEQQLSTSISEMRLFWQNGVRDAAGETYSGLSTTTPREYFNAYPAAKPNFTIAGTGRWQYQDGNASTGTAITAQNFSMALGSLYAYEGTSTQVTTISDWLRGFTANSSFASTGSESQSQFARSVLGAFDATSAPTTVLLVRDANNGYTAISKNGSGLYDWGAFGLLSSLWGTRNTASFTQSRMLPLGRNQRFLDGVRNDGDHFDWITLRGLSGLGYQTAFTSDTINPGGTQAYPAGSTGTGVTSPPTLGLVQWLKGDAGITLVSGRVSQWDDQSGLGQHFMQGTAAERPYLLGDTINGIPAISFGVAGDANKHMSTAGNFVNRYGVAMTGSSARTIMTVSRPSFDAAYGRTGGTMWSHSTWYAMFELRSDFVANGAYAWMRAAGDYGNALQFTPVTGGSGGPYDGATLITEHNSPAFPTLTFRVNNAETTLTPADMYGAPGAGGVASLSELFIAYLGAITEVLVWDWSIDNATRTQAIAYLTGRYSSAPVTSVSLSMTNDAVRAAQFGQSFRVNPHFPMSV